MKYYCEKSLTCEEFEKNQCYMPFLVTHSLFCPFYMDDDSKRVYATMPEFTYLMGKKIKDVER